MHFPNMLQLKLPKKQQLSIKNHNLMSPATSLSCYLSSSSVNTLLKRWHSTQHVNSRVSKLSKLCMLMDRSMFHNNAKNTTGYSTLLGSQFPCISCWWNARYLASTMKLGRHCLVKAVTRDMNHHSCKSWQHQKVVNISGSKEFW